MKIRFGPKVISDIYIHFDSDHVTGYKKYLEKGSNSKLEKYYFEVIFL